MVAVARLVVEQLHKQFKHRETLGKDYLYVFTTTTMDPFSIMIPMLPPFSLSSTPRNVLRKQRNLEDHHSPAKCIQEDAQKDSPSLGCLESATRFPLSLSKRKNNLEKQLLLLLLSIHPLKTQRHMQSITARCAMGRMCMKCP